MLKIFVERRVDTVNHIDSSHAPSVLFVRQFVAVFDHVSCSVARSNARIEIKNRLSRVVLTGQIQCPMVEGRYGTSKQVPLAATSSKMQC
jgi:hypothetical protein